MNKIINKSKYTVPSIPDIIERSRLFDLLGKSDGKKAVFIIGQAAQGKSTLVASYVKSDKRPTIWMHLEKEDSDHNLFYNLLIRAINAAIGNDILPSDTQAFSLGPRKNLLRQKEVIKFLTTEMTQSMNLVIDNTEALSIESRSYDLIHDLIKNNNSINIYIISREMPPINIQDFKIKQEITIISNSELSFSIDETELFFNKLTGVEINKNTAISIKSFTEGWIGGLVLLSESIKNSSNGSKQFNDKDFPEMLKKESFDFFFQGIFIKQEESVRKFLIYSSIFDVIIPDVINKINITNDAELILETMEKRNLFIHTIYDGLEKKYRFNSLFREFLESIYEQETSIAEKQKIYSCAGNIFESFENYEEAMKFYLKGDNHESACDMIIKTGTDFIITNRDNELKSKIIMLPKEYLEKETWIFFYLTLTERIKGGYKNLHKLKDAYDRFKKEDKLRGRILSLAFLIESSVFLGRSPEKLMILLNEGKLLLTEIAGTELFIYARTLLWQQIGFAYIAGGLSFTKGLSACRNSHILAVKIDDQSLIISSMIVSAMGYAFTGEIQLSETSLEKIEGIGKNLTPEYRTLRNIVDIANSLNKCDIKNCEFLLNLCRENIESHGLLFLYPVFIELSGQFEIQRKNYDKALKTSNHLNDIAVLSGSDYYSGLSLRLSALTHYHMKHYEKALKLSIGSKKLLNPDQQDNYYGSCAKLINCLIRINTGSGNDLRIELNDLLSYFKDPNQFERTDVIKALVIVSFLDEDYKNITNLLKELQPDRSYLFQRTYISTIDNIKFALIAFIFDSKIISKKEIDAYNSKDIKNTSLFLKSVIKKNESDLNGLIMRKIEKYSLSKVKITTLGDFTVEIDGRVIRNNEWGGKKPLLLFKYILAFGCTNIPKDILIDALWPEANASSGEKNFKVNLHRLRKVFGLNNSSSYVILKHNNVSLSLDLFEIDFLKFEEKISISDSNYNENDNKEFYSLCREIYSLYGGDFLSNELYEEVLVKKRDGLKNSYLKILEYLSVYAEKKGLVEDFIYYNIKIVAIDPLNETACRRLMLTYKREKKVNSAIKIYNDLKNYLNKEIGVSPDPDTIKLYEELT
ncbi:MAG: hypothetical protein GY714_30625 [Desulfobacterales bacterium]|nr:hypothetical protein [Desulfobacterales bacterium]